MIKKMTVKDVAVRGKKCFVRCDFNVPMSDKKITDDTRITAALPTIKYLMGSGAKVILCSHLGRPKGEFNLKYSLAPVAERLSTLLDSPVKFAHDVIGEDATQKVEELKDGEVLLLENVRFYKQEEANDRDFCAALAKFCDIYVGEAFGAAHRAHASTAGMVQYGFVQTAVAGFLMDKEVKNLSLVTDEPRHPFVAILGGAKVSDKIGVIQNLINKADTILIGGGMAYTFIKAQGHEVGGSLVDLEKIELANRLMDEAKQKGVKLLVPVDSLVAESFPDPIDSPVKYRAASISDIKSNEMGLDIGPETVKLYRGEIEKAASIVWNGPMGVFENPLFAEGTHRIADFVANNDGITVIGGGDSVAAINQTGLADKITHISTGGGASLEFLEGKKLPGIECLKNL